METLLPELLGPWWFSLSDFKSRFEVLAILEIFKNKPGGVKFSTESQKFNFKNRS